MGAGARLIAVFAGLSLMAVATGCLVAQANDVPTSVWGRNLVVWPVGLGGAVALARADAERAATTLVILALVAIGATLLSEGLSGVRRWVVLGPVRLNCAEVFLPGLIVGLARLGPSRRWPWFTVPAVGAVLALQPDASQAVALAGAVLAVLVVLRPPPTEAAVAGLGSAAAAIWAVLRPDPLDPVAEVEGIVGLAAALSPAAALVAVTALAGASLAPLWAGRRDAGSVRGAGIGLASYFVLVALAPAFGAFPVPLVGMGVSPIIGSWIGIGLLASVGGRVGRPRE